MYCSRKQDTKDTKSDIDEEVDSFFLRTPSKTKSGYIHFAKKLMQQ